MDIARHVFDTYFKDTTNPLVRHHLDSYADLLNTKLPDYIRGSNPSRLTLVDNRAVDVYIGGRDGTKIFYLPPVDELGNAILPHTCRLENKTYALDVRATFEVVYTFADKKEEVRSFENVLIGKMPLMVRSHLCYLSTMTSEEMYGVGECKFELGGYFIIGGAEKVLLSQEHLGTNMFYAGKRPHKPAGSDGKRTLVEKEKSSKLQGAIKGEPDEYFSAVRSASEDGTKGPYSHFLVIPPQNNTDLEDNKVLLKLKNMEKETGIKDYGQLQTDRLAIITLPGFTQPVPLLSVFYALGVTSDRDLYDTIFAGLPDSEKESYDRLFAELVLSHQKFTEQEMMKEKDSDQDPDLLFLARQTRTRSESGVFMNLTDDMFPHCEHGESKMRRKAYLLGHMTKMAIDIAVGIAKPSDRDHYRYKRIDSSGELCFQEFRRVFKEVSKSMLTKLDSTLHYQTKAFEGAKFPELVQEERIGSIWRSYTFLSEFEKSFKKQWGGKDGISQELSRLAYLGSVSHLRRVNLQINKDTKIGFEPRRVHGSSWGLMCPTDGPDDGLFKTMTMFCTLSKATPSQLIIQYLKQMKLIPLHLIHPSTWNPIWTKVFVNSDLAGVIPDKNTEVIHGMLLELRRSGDIPSDVSLAWNRTKNEYNIFTDAGRPIRPVYREGVGQNQVKQIKTWSNMAKNVFDYVDAQESDTIRISMEPFSQTLPSEIHGLAIFSPSTSIIPHSDFNQAPRNVFSCQQTRQACSWYNTAFNKRFDTLSTWLNYAQRPLSTTWTYNQILGCLPYGENAIVALAIYSGYNQEDSILLNDTALKRGLFNTTYYHSYDITEKMIDMEAQTHTEFGNVAANSKFRDTVARKEGYNYDLLDGDGFIREGVEIDDKTILAGIVSPKMNNNGEVIAYVDSSYSPKRGQHGIVDSVYRYTTKDGLLGIKVRIAESRVPVLGDKYSARHGQKGTVGMRIPEEDMPYTSTGLRPDMIVNPHAFPSRMTIGQFTESMSTKLGLHMGCSVDATPFSSQNRVPETKMLLEKAGFHPYGHEILYNGQTGEMIESEIFMGPTYYLRLKHMVEDKLNYRATGPKKLLTHQPTDGRANDGGLRIGEMERDVLIAHGISKFLNESMMDRSDGSTMLMDPETGRLDAKADTETVKVSFPYSLGVLVKELEANHLSVKLISS